jgi:hypothetical protein
MGSIVIYKYGLCTFSRLLNTACHRFAKHTVHKMDLILRSIERMLQTQLSMARRFKLQVLRRYDVKFYKMRKLTLDEP